MCSHRQGLRLVCEAGWLPIAPNSPAVSLRKGCTGSEIQEDWWAFDSVWERNFLRRSVFAKASNEKLDRGLAGPSCAGRPSRAKYFLQREMREEE